MREIPTSIAENSTYHGLFESPEFLDSRKASGSYYTPNAIVRSLVSWVVRRPTDRMIDPACGDGRFLAAHPNSVGVEQDPLACAVVHQRTPGCLIHQGDFFSWAERTRERFDCAAGNPPFIRYQRFTGAAREAAQRLCKQHGAIFTSLSSSWAPFLVATASLLRPGGRMAFVVPAEIGHAPYSTPVLDYMTRCFNRVQVVAVREKLFPELAEDCWFLYADGYGGSSNFIDFTPVDRFSPSSHPPNASTSISLDEWRRWNSRLRPFLLSAAARDLYLNVADSPTSFRLGAVAKVGIGYVTGSNDFFHLRPSDAHRLGISSRFLRPAVRSGRNLAGGSIDDARLRAWIEADEPVLLLHLNADTELPLPVRRYLDSQAGRVARDSYKCRNRDPWYVVPDVTVPEGFLSYMSGNGPSFVANQAACVCTNSVHAVHLTAKARMSDLTQIWKHPITTLSCEVEGHPLGGGMLKVEPREARQIVLSTDRTAHRTDFAVVTDAINTMRRWRHCDTAA